MITVVVSQPVKPPARHVRLAYDIVGMAGEFYTPAELVETVEGWGTEEWGQVDLDGPTPTVDQRGKILAVLAARCPA